MTPLQAALVLAPSLVVIAWRVSVPIAFLVLAVAAYQGRDLAGIVALLCVLRALDVVVGWAAVKR